MTNYAESDGSRPGDGGFTRRVVAASLALAMLLALAIAFEPFEGRAFVAVIDLLPIPIYAGAAGLAGLAAVRSTRSSRVGWWFISGGIVSYVLGDIAWAVFEVGFAVEPPTPSLADAFYLAAIPLLLTGVLVLSSSARTLGQFRTVLSATLVVLGLAALVWGPILQPILTSPDTGWAGTVVTAAYPVGDGVLVFAVFVAARRQWDGRSRIVLYTFAGGMLLATGSDLAFAKLVLDGSYESGSVIDLGWPLGFLLMGWAAGLHARWSVDLAAEMEPRPQSAAGQRMRVAMIVAQALLLASLAAFGLAGGFSEEPALIVLLMAMVSVDLVRGALAIADATMQKVAAGRYGSFEANEPTAGRP
jgi:hypothetical protein